MKTIVVAPHPDDELLGCGGTLLRRKAEGGEVAWLIVTSMLTEDGWPDARVRIRGAEIEAVAAAVGFDDVLTLGFSASRLDTIPIAELVSRLGGAFQRFGPSEVFLPHPGDAHSDHAAVFHAGAACTKWFRYSSVRRVLTYETLSETDFGLNPNDAFRPNYFVDISRFLPAKLDLLHAYKSEMGEFPFPRSARAVRSLAEVRGVAAGCEAAEAFCLLREREHDGE